MIFLEDDLRSILAKDEITSTNAEIAVATIASWVNDFATHDLGRDFLIRLLAKKPQLPEHLYDLIDGLLMTTGLLPYAGPPRTLEDALFREAHTIPNLDGDRVFHSLQLQVFRLIMNKKNVILSATTSVGKSVIVDAIIASGRFRKIVVIVPTIALIDETRRRISRIFGNTHSIITHPTQESDGSLPTIYVLTQERVLSRKDLENVDFFVVDEFYKLDLDRPDNRAVDLNLAFHRLASSGAQFYLIGPHISEVRGIASRYQHVFLPSTFSTVALDIEYFNLSQTSDDRETRLLELVRDLKTPTLIYCQSPPKCGEVARILIKSEYFSHVSETEIAVDWLLQEFPEEWIVIEALQRGIGIHHGNVPRALQHYMVRCFEEGSIRFLVCTSTIIEGVNTVAENVIVYDRRLNTTTLDSFTFRNIAGRAGRMGQWFIGKVYVLESPIEDEQKAVILPIEDQDTNTPMSLLLDLPDSDLSDLSFSRIEDALRTSTLSLATLRANRYISIDAQRQIADRIRSDLVYLKILNWRGMPSARELTAACELIYEYIDEGRSLKAYQIFGGEQLSARLFNLSSATLRSFIADRVARRRDDQSVSDAVELTLRFMRSYVVHTFPRQLSAINTIYKDVALALGFDVAADYSFYTARTENLFLESGLFALDEYGVPPQTAYRLGSRYPGMDSLNKALDLIASIDLEQEKLHPFEQDLLHELQRSLARRD
ncbi:superfamily II helicase [Acetobacter indonesiensis NRIC 0313]|uniref:Helicase n=1 Tax=Acetobacter indonesiensis TaxID=104101 RepID=A0A6N3T914_9PROT|nr:DEAD/DEAH box helicase [Acetobacter indonesiensis]GAN62496.1 helicase [Acetobacter indonesiensis]GBQ58654.1 superfamily II helicase [Acetobacter indonesiensis NRIC 0313]GEN04700.1 hypothetical protein AIN02nite_27250 [Acetobacter indonesiensis]